MSRIFGKKQKIFEISLQKAQKLLETGKFSETATHLHSFEPLDKKMRHQQVQFYTLLSTCYYYLGNYQKAREMGEQAVHVAQNIKPCLEGVDAHLRLAEVLKFLEQNTESLALLDDVSDQVKQLEKISKKERKRRIGLVDYHRAGNMYYSGNTKKAFEFGKKSGSILERCWTEGDKARCYSSFGWFQSFIGEIDEAFHYWTKSQEICLKLDSPLVNFQQITNFLGLGSVHESRNEIQKAGESFENSLFCLFPLGILSYCPWLKSK